MAVKQMQIGPWTVGGDDGPLFVIAGPCVIEDDGVAMRTAETLKQVADAEGVPLIYKSSYDKANRSSIASYRGPGLDEGLKILERVRDATGLPILSDVHTPEECAAAGDVLDVLQIPAFLCRQTDLLAAAAKTGKVVNVKKGQFLAPWDMGHVVKKVADSGNDRIWVTERGSTFGYNTLVADMRSIPIMRKLGYPVVFDGGHSVQKPGGLGATSGGDRDLIPTLARAAVAAGADGFFCETHPDPDNAKSDGPNQWPVGEFGALVRSLQRVHAAVRAGDR